MRLWKPAILGAVLAVVAACQPVGTPIGEKRLAEKIADVLISDDMLASFVREPVQGLMYQGAVSQDQVSQVAIAVSRELDSKLPDVKASLVDGLTREMNIKELELFHTLLTSEVAKSALGKQEAAMSASQQMLAGLAQEAATRAVARVNSAWPTGPQTAVPPQPQGLPPGMVLPN